MTAEIGVVVGASFGCEREWGGARMTFFLFFVWLVVGGHSLLSG